MRLREFRREDADRLFTFLKSEFPEEEAVLGTRPEGFRAIVDRLFRPDLRIALAVLRALGRPPFRLYVAEEDGGIVGTTLLSFAARAGFLSMVVVAPSHRRRGFARSLLEAARAASARRGRPYVALSVLTTNAPALALYTALGYRTLSSSSFLVHERPGEIPPPPPDAGLRPFRRADARAVAALLARSTPAPVQEVLPVRASELRGGGMADRVLGSATATWVVDRGRGPEAHLSATSTPATEAAHLSNPIVGEGVEPAVALALVRAASSWLAARGARRLVAGVPADNPRGRRALEEAGFHEALSFLTLYRPSS